MHLVSDDNPLLLIFLAFLCLLIAQGFLQLTNYLGYLEALRMQRRFAERLYDKMLSLRADTMSQRPIGEIVSLYATDIPGATMFLEQTLPSGATTLFPLLLAPFALSMYFDIPLWPTVSMMIFVSFVNTALAFRQSTYFFKFKILAAQRIGLVNEWIQNIRTIRILGRMSFFERQIFDVREIETENRVRMVTNGQSMNAISTSVTFGLNAIALGSMVFLSNDKLSPGEIMALLWILAVFLTRPFRQMPWFFTMGFDSWTSLKRLHEFLQIQSETPLIQPSLLAKDPKENPWALEVKSLNLSIGGKRILKEIDFDVKKGEFVAIVGEVGAGKSMLLLSLLRETAAEFKTYQLLNENALLMSPEQLRKKFSYVPQESFIMSASLRDNVAFLYDTPSEIDVPILESLKLSQFNLETESSGLDLNTEIGERGVNLSGGQRQRVSLARVNFLNNSILLLDDCLSALDVGTEEKLLESLLNGAWAQKTRVLVTHRLSVLPAVDRIFFMSEGQILKVGTYKQLLKEDSSFRAYTRSIQKSEGSDGKNS